MYIRTYNLGTWNLKIPGLWRYVVENEERIISLTAISAPYIHRLQVFEFDSVTEPCQIRPTMLYILTLSNQTKSYVGNVGDI
jgi:hypothetical protein